MYDNYLGNFSVFLLLTLDQSVRVYLNFVCSNCFENAKCKSHLYVAKLRTHCSYFFGLSGAVICPVTSSSMYVFWKIFLYTLQLFRKIPLGA